MKPPHDHEYVFQAAEGFKRELCTKTPGFATGIKSGEAGTSSFFNDNDALAEQTHEKHFLFCPAKAYNNQEIAKLILFARPC